MRFSSPKAVRAAVAGLTAAALAAAATAVPDTARSMASPPGAYHLTGASDAAQSGRERVVGFSPGVSDAAQRTAARPVTFSPGVSDAAQRTAAESPAAAPSTARTVTVADDGFDWSSAILGAGAAGLLVVGIGGALAIMPKRRVVGHA